MPILGATGALAPLESPTFSGTPTVPTAAPGTNTTQAASTAFVGAAVAAGGGGGATWVTLVAAPTGVAATDYANITAALATAATAGGIVQLRSGVYATTQTILIPGGVTLRGTGIDYAQTTVAPAKCAIIRATSAIAGAVVKVGEWLTGFGDPSFVTGKTAAQLADVVVDGGGLADYAVEQGGVRSYIRNCQIYRGVVYSLYFTGQNSYTLDSVIGSNNQGTTVWIGGYDNKVMRCQIRGHGSSGAGVEVNGEGTVVQGCHIFPNGPMITTAGPDILINNVNMALILDNDIDQVNNHQIKIQNGSNILISGNLIRMYGSTDNTYDAIHIDATTNGPFKGVTVVGNTIRGGGGSNRYRSIVGRSGTIAVVGRVIGNHGEYASAVLHNLAGLTQSGNSAFAGTTTTYGDRAGAATFSGTGSQTAFTIAHGLYATPTTFGVVAQSAVAAAPFYVTADATNLTVTYTSAPASGTNNVLLNWHAEV